MGIKGLTLKKFKTIVKKSIDQAAKNGQVAEGHIRITWAWLKTEEDEDVFETLKKSKSAREYIKKLLPVEESDGKIHNNV